LVTLPLKQLRVAQLKASLWTAWSLMETIVTKNLAYY
jgi:hypothetical protein